MSDAVSAPLRIMFVIDCLGASGAERSTAALLPLLRARGHQVQVVTLYDSGFGDEDVLRSDGFNITPLTSTRYLGRVRELRERVQRFRPDIVHTALSASDLVGRAAAWRTGARVVSSVVNTPYDPRRFADQAIRPWKLRIVQLLDAATAHAFVTRLHAVSDGVADAAARTLRFDRSRITVVERGRSRDTLGEPSAGRRNRIRAQLGIADDVELVLSVGRHEYQKAHDDLVEAMAAVLSERAESRLLLAGRDGNATPALRAALAAHPDVDAATSVLGHRGDVADLMVAADVLVISSRYEGTAGVALEAMALECPIVCTDVEGVRGILDDMGNAVLVPVGSTDAIGRGIVGVLADGDLRSRLRARGRADFERRFTIDVAAEAMIAMYRSALRDHR